MADKRISQLAERTDIANNDVVAIVASGATVTNKATMSSIQAFMQGALDVGVTTVGVTISEIDTAPISVTGSPINQSGNITINLPRATNSIRGVLDTEDFIIFSNKQSTITLTTSGTSGASTFDGSALNIPNYSIGVLSLGAIGTNPNANGATITGTVLNLQPASISFGGVVTTGTQTFEGFKIFNGTIGVDQDIRLVTKGTALNTFITNINATGLTSVGSNGFGFNNANNIYFSGSNKGGGVFAFSNTGTRTYTLQDATGTIAFTSDLGAYLPLAGGTLTGPLNGNTTATFNGDIQTNSRFLSFNGGEFIILQPNSGGTVNTITASGGLPLRITTGSSIGLAAGGTIPQLTISTAGVTTLTGALNGTSAVFSGTLTLNGANNVIRSGNELRFNRADNAIFSRIFDAGSSFTFDNLNGNGFSFQSAGTNQFSIASTGEATFTGALNGTSAVFSGGVQGLQFVTGGTPSNTAGFTNSFYAESSFPSLTLSNTGGNTGKYTFGVTAGALGIWNNVTSAYEIFIDPISSGQIQINRAAIFSSSVTAESGKFFSANGTTYASAAQLRVDGGGVNNNYAQIIFSDSALSDGKISYFPANLAADRFFSISARITESDFVIRGNGNVGIGTDTPSFQLQLSTDSAAKPTTALWTIASDARIKENITPYEKGLNELMQINPINYDYNGLGGFTKGKGGVGIIAQDIADILPDSVNSYPAKLNEDDEEETDVLNFNGHELIYVLINSIKELKIEIDSLKNV